MGTAFSVTAIAAALTMFIPVSDQNSRQGSDETFRQQANNRSVMLRAGMLREVAERTLQATYASVPSTLGITQLVVIYKTNLRRGKMISVRYKFDKQGDQRVTDWKELPEDPTVQFGRVRKYGFGSMCFGQ